jgi:flagellar basal-body rod protein FlgF
MENSMYIAISKQMALSQRMSLVSNNIANMNTPGFKSEHMLAIEELVEQKDVEEKDGLSFVSNYGQFRSLGQGPLEFTGNDLDVALEGPGFFAIENRGETFYTRAGNFKLTNENVLVNASGLPVLDEGEGIIEIPATVQQVTISHEGVVIGDDQPIAQLMVAEFDNSQDMRSVGGGLYETQQKPAPAEMTRTIQGSIEKSNVNGVLEMTNLIEISRQYQSTARLLQNEHDRAREAIRKLAEVQA